MVHFLDSHLAPRNLYRLGLPDKIRIGSENGEDEYEKYAIAVVVEIPKETLLRKKLDPKDNLHTFCYIKTLDGWITVDNNRVVENVVDDLFHKTHALGQTLVMYRKYRGEDKKFHPRFLKNDH